MYKFFSAKYFPEGSIRNALVHPKSSYTWKSIIHAREVVHKGAIWRIGNGKKIKFWDHQWLPKPGCSKLYLLEQVLLWLGSVSCFIQILESGIRVNWLLVFYLGD